MTPEADREVRRQVLAETRHEIGDLGPEDQRLIRELAKTLRGLVTIHHGSALFAMMLVIAETACDVVDAEVYK
jgi:hypothetical protein